MIFIKSLQTPITRNIYYIGATLTYTINGNEHVTEVSPDYVFVKPMPKLVLDYFIPHDVYGDDAFTTQIEPEIPFPLGVRVTNNGAGSAKSLKIASAQPKIVENELGLLIGFYIQGSEVNGEGASSSLLVDFGDIAPNRCGLAHWNMTCSLSGKFVEFTADYSHSDELGGELTSLIDTFNTHFLVKDVLTDLPGRDGIRDFLAEYGQGLKVYESENLDTEVTDQSAGSRIDGSGGTYTLTAPVTAGFMYARLPDPCSGAKALTDVLRSDGKRIKPENAWLSKTRDKDNNWQYFVNLFDANTTGPYTLVFEAIPPSPVPVMQFVPDRFGGEGTQLGFIVEASVADNTIPVLTASSVPAGASFVDDGSGIGWFDWTPAQGQAGTYPVKFTAKNGDYTASRTCTITITSGDNDNDQIPDWWELQHFGTLDRDGTGDFDKDGISDLNEFINGTDPSFFKGDINNDRQVDAKDAIVALQILGGMMPNSEIKKEAAVSGNDQVGLADAIYGLQEASGL
ncbi:hypothetical protein QUF76_07270 [Desulfobacterales bacterium HSG16]|nr:hypothetical protein [Desulfobacterales bacterium HSG16]